MQKQNFGRCDKCERTTEILCTSHTVLVHLVGDDCAVYLIQFCLATWN